MIAVLINLCAKAMAGIVAEAIKEQVSDVPWKMSEPIVTEVGEAVGIQQDKVKDFVRFAKNTANVITVGEAAFNPGKSEGGGDWISDAANLISVVTATRENLSIILNRRRVKESPIRYTEVESEKETQASRKIPRKRTVRRPPKKRITPTATQIRVPRPRRTKDE